MQNLITVLSTPNPSSYLGKNLNLRYEQIRSRMIEDAKRLLRVEYESALKVSRSKRRLSGLQDISLDCLTRRLRFLIKAHGQEVTEESLALIEREKHYRVARLQLARLRMYKVNGASETADSGSLELSQLAEAMKSGGITNRDIYTNTREIKSFEKRMNEVIDARVAARERRRAERRLNTASGPAA